MDIPIPATCMRTAVKHTPASVRSLAKSHSGDLFIGFLKGIGHCSQTIGPLISSKKSDRPTQEALRCTGETELGAIKSFQARGKPTAEGRMKEWADVRASFRMANRAC